MVEDISIVNISQASYLMSALEIKAKEVIGFLATDQLEGRFWTAIFHHHLTVYLLPVLKCRKIENFWSTFLVLIV